MNNRTKKISHYIGLKTLPWLITILAVSSVLLVSLANQIIEHQLNDRHSSLIQSFNEKLENNINSLKEQVTNISKNDLIINSLIDPEESKNYLPLFIQSFALSGIKNTYIKITDFSGDTIAENQISNDYQIDQKIWEETVLIEGKTVSTFDSKGLFIASPIIFAQSAEGAVVASIEFQEIKNLLPSTKGEITLITDQSGLVLYSSNIEEIPENIIFNKKYLSDYFQKEEAINDFKIISAEKNSLAYSKFYLLVLFIVAAIGCAIVISMVGILLSSKIISKTLKDFINAASAIKKQGVAEAYILDNDETEELASIKREFNYLVDDLFETRLLKNNIQSIINSLNEYLIVLDKQGNTTMINLAFERLTKEISSSEEQHFKKIFPKNVQQNALNTGKTINDFEHSYCLENSNQKECIIRWSRSLYYSDKGDLQGVIFIGTDITNEKAIEKDLHIKNRAIEEASSGIVIANALKEDMPLVYVNKQFLSMTGYDYHEVIHKNCRFLQGKNTDEESIQRIRQAIDHREKITETFLNYKKDGTEFYNQLTLTPIHDQDNRVTHYLGIQFDATERVKFDQDLMEAKQKAEESAQLKSEFLASMSHEIRTPMNGVLGMLGLLDKTTLDSKQAHYTKLATSSAESLLKLINDILDFSKVEAGKMELDIIEFDLLDLLGDTAETMAQRAQEKGLELILDVSTIDEKLVLGDPSRLRQVLTNLLGNAIKFTEKGEITLSAKIETTDKQSHLVCSVADTGIGIPANKVDNLFDSFSQVDASTTRKYGGTGLGLAIVKKLCELMKGSISVSSNLDGGSEFCFFIQLEKVSGDHSIIATLPEIDGNILVIDPCESNRNTMIQQLRCWHINASGVDDEKSALAVLEKTTLPFSMIIASTQMTDISHSHFATIRKQNPSLPLVLMTPISQRISDQQMIEMGISGSFTKPATTKDMLGIIDLLNTSDEKASEPQYGHPAQEDEVDAIPETVSTSSHEPNSQTQASDNRRFHLLLVEDNIINQEVALGILNALGFDADIANNGLEAINILNEHAGEYYDLIFMDCQMPEMDGYDATKAIRSGKTPKPNIPIVAMTANAMKGDKEKCLTAGMDDYISKPIDPDKIKECLQHWLQVTDFNSTHTEEKSDMSEDTQIWDKDGFMKRVMNNDSIADKLITLFQADAPSTIKELESSINAEQTEQAGLLAHKLKGSASNLGGIQLAEVLQKIELAGKDDNLDEVKALWPQVNPKYDSLIANIEQQRQ